MFSKKLEYGYIIMKTLKYTDKFNMMSGREIISRSQIPLNMGLSILSELANGNLIHSVKGKKGGFYRDNNEVTLYQLFFVLENENFNSKGYLDINYQKDIFSIALVVLKKMNEIKI